MIDLGSFDLRSLTYDLEIEVKVKGQLDVLDFDLCFKFVFVHYKTIKSSAYTY